MYFKKCRKQIVAVMDVFIIIVTCLFLYAVFNDTRNPSYNSAWSIVASISTFLVIMLAFQTILSTYKSLWRYADGKEYLTLFAGMALSYACYLPIDKFLIKSEIPLQVTLCGVSVSYVLMLLMRFTYKIYRRDKRSAHQVGKRKVVIVGAGNAGINLMEEFRCSDVFNYTTVCFFDDDEAKIGKNIHGVIVKGEIMQMPNLLSDIDIDEIIVAIPSMKAGDKRRILAVCSSLKCKVKILPDYVAMIKEDKLSKNIRNIDIADLLGRNTITFGGSEIKNFVSGKTVMVTGGGGSIGSEICRQVAKFNPKRIVIVDIYENNAYSIQQELLYEYGDLLDLKVEIASVRDVGKVDLLFERYRPQVVVHAAAHKHVPFMEDCPEEAIKNNVKGTYNMVHAADRYGVSKFVLISTDKAVNPTNAMGASKRLCEMVMQSMQSVSKTTYVAVRFGNVLGSNGSVIPLFKHQIEHGGPVTITDIRIIRYFMTIPEAAQLVLQAGAMARRSEIYVLDMGEPVKILDLAQNLIRLSGYIPYTEIPIEEVGLRPGEKLYEELLIDSNKLLKTTNEKIFIEKQEAILPEDIESKLIILDEAIQTHSNEQIKIAMKKVVPTYRDADEVNSKSFVLDYSDITSESDLEVSGRHQATA